MVGYKDYVVPVGITRVYRNENGSIRDIRVGAIPVVKGVSDGRIRELAGEVVVSGLSGYATELWVDGRGYLTSASLDSYASKGWVEAKGYITVSSLNGYATQQWVQQQGYLTSQFWNRDAVNGYLYPSTLSDKLGIGTNAPSYPLTILSTYSGLFNSAGLVVSNSLPQIGSGAIWLGADPYYKAVFDYSYPNKLLTISGGVVIGNIAFYTGYSEKMRIDNNGNIGIGKTNPSYALEVSRAIGNGAYDGIRITNTSGNASGGGMVDFYNPYSGGISSGRIFSEIGGAGNNSTMTFSVANSSKILITKMIMNGSYILVKDNSATGFGTPAFAINGISAFQTLGFGYLGGTYYPAEIGYANVDASGYHKGDIVFGTRSVTTNTVVTERMRITNMGNVGIRTNDPTRTTDINGNLRVRTLADGSGSAYTKILVADADGNIDAINKDTLALSTHTHSSINGTFTTVNGMTITITNGIVTNIVE